MIYLIRLVSINPTPPGGSLVNISLRAGGINILKFTVFVPILGGVVEEEHPSKIAEISNN